jgi:hypothetical protein
VGRCGLWDGMDDGRHLSPAPVDPVAASMRFDSHLFLQPFTFPPPPPPLV